MVSKRLLLILSFMGSLILTSCGMTTTSGLIDKGGSSAEEIVEVKVPESTQTLSDDQITSLTFDLPGGTHTITIQVDESLFSDVGALFSQALQDDRSAEFNRPEMFCLELQGFISPGALLTPQICMLPAETYASMNPEAALQIQELKTLLSDKPMLDQPISPLPYLPLANAVQVMQSHPAFLSAQSSNGIRYLTAHVQSPVPVTNKTLIYTYQGLTQDGEFLISAALPITHPALSPEKILSESGSATEGFQLPIEAYENYGQELTAQLDAYGPDDFTPSITTLDRLMRQILIQRSSNSIGDSSQSEAAVDQAIRSISKLLGVDEDEVTMIDAIAIEWSDSCLGIPEQDTLCAQVLTPGFKILLDCSGITYEIHSNQDGSQIRMMSPDTVISPGQHSTTLQQIKIQEAGLEFELPDDWQQLDPDWRWMQMGNPNRIIGVTWESFQPPVLPEAAMLPKNAVVLDRVPLELGWATAYLYQVEVFSTTAEKEPVGSNFQAHALIVTAHEGSKRVIDFYGEALTREDILELTPILSEVLRSLEPLG